MNDPLALQVRALRAGATSLVAQCDALLAGLGERPEADAPEANQVCAACGEARFQVAAGDVFVCGVCGANYRNGEVVNG